jgi:hypothetical protein
MKNEILKEAVRREDEDLARFKNILKNKRLVIIIGAEIIFNITADISGISLSRLTWTNLIRNNLNYLIIDNYIDALSRRTRRIYAIFEETDTDSLLDIVNIIIDQLEKHRQFPI